MLDIKFIRENADLVKQNMQKKHQDSSFVDTFLTIDEEYRKLLGEEQQFRAKRNKLSEQINKLKKEGKDASDLLQEVKSLPDKIKALDKKLDKTKKEWSKLHRLIPNLIHASVPKGDSEKENVVLSEFGTINKSEVKPHQQIAEELGLADFSAAAKTSGNGFYYLQGNLALLNQALIRFAIDVMIKEGFTYVEAPLMLRGDIIENVVDLHDQENQIYKIDQEDLYLIGTSEHSLIGRFVGQTFEEKQLPILQTSYSMCFRKEKGSHGLDERGLFRTHQFNKVEMIVICKPKESEKYYAKMQNITISLMKQLELPGRVLQLCSGDLGNLKHNQVDIEIWSPRRNEYIEAASCSNLTDAQARLLSIKAQGKERYTPHTLNNTALATSRILVAILENNQKEGRVIIPKVLVPYMNGIKEL